MRRMARHTGVILAGVMLLGPASPARAAVTLTASRAEVLYSSDDNPDCTVLSQTADAALPFNAVRLKVQVDGQDVPPGTKVKWSFPDPAVGILAADEALGPDDSTSGIVGFCAEFGNECVLTKQKLAFYTKPTILWLGPTCDTLPEKTKRAFPGDSVRFRVKLPGLGKAKANVGYGHVGSTTLFITDLQGQFKDGIGKPDGVLGFFNPLAAATASVPTTMPTGEPFPVLETFEFDSGGGGGGRVPPPCDPATGGCIQFEYPAPGRYVATLTAKLVDESALCDRLVYRVAACEGAPVLELIKSPNRQTYKSGQSVRLRARLHNRSPQENGCDFVLTGKVLTCSAELKVGGIEETHTGDVEFQRCSSTDTQPCDNDSDCECTAANCPCEDCVPNEFCITYSHCSTTLTRQCASDADCHPPVCPECFQDEHCVDVIPVARAFLRVGQSMDILDTTVGLKNSLPDTAQIKETWTVTTDNAGSDDAKLNYKIRGTR
jgi:hypothetical protein